jgi:hypothetical protein
VNQTKQFFTVLRSKIEHALVLHDLLLIYRLKIEMHCLELFLQLQKQLRMNEIFVLMTGVIVSCVQVQKFLSKMKCYGVCL